jgi:hypothetical protein
MGATGGTIGLIISALQFAVGHRAEIAAISGGVEAAIKVLGELHAAGGGTVTIGQIDRALNKHGVNPGAIADALRIGPRPEGQGQAQV